MCVGGVHRLGLMSLEVFSSFSDSELLQVIIKLGMGTEPCTSRADLTGKNVGKEWKNQPGVD